MLYDVKACQYRCQALCIKLSNTTHAKVLKDVDVQQTSHSKSFQIRTSD